MSRRKIKAGSTSQILPVFIQDTSSTTGAGLGSLVYNTASLAAKYRRQGDSSWTAITLVTATAGTFTSGGFVADGGSVTGGYEIGLPNAMLAAGATWAQLQIYGAANMLAVLVEFELDAVDYQDTVRFGLTALPNVASGSAGGLIVQGTGTTGLDVSSGKVLLQATQTGVTIPTVTTVGTTTNLTNNNDKTGYTLLTSPPTAAAIATQVWTDLVSGSDFSTAGSAGKLLKDNIDATVSSRLSSGSYSAPPSAAAISTQVQTDLGTGSALTSLASQSSVNTLTAYVDTEVAAILDAVSSSGVVLSVAQMNKIADHVLRRNMANVEASSSGDTLSLSSQYGTIQQAQESSLSGVTLTVKKTDGSTTLGTKTVTTSSSANPITGIS